MLSMEYESEIVTNSDKLGREHFWVKGFMFIQMKGLAFFLGDIKTDCLDFRLTS